MANYDLHLLVLQRQSDSALVRSMSCNNQVQQPCPITHEQSSEARTFVVVQYIEIVSLQCHCTGSG